MHDLTESLSQPCDVGTVKLPILQVGESRHRDVNSRKAGPRFSQCQDESCGSSDMSRVTREFTVQTGTPEIKRAQTVDTQDHPGLSPFSDLETLVQLFLLPLILKVPQAPKTYLSKLQRIISPTTCPPAPPSTFLCKQQPTIPPAPLFLSLSYPAYQQILTILTSKHLSICLLSKVLDVGIKGLQGP